MLRNGTAATQARLSIASHDRTKLGWDHPEIDWEKEASALIPLTPHGMDFEERVVEFADLPALAPNLKRLRIEPALGVTTGTWEIASIRID
jgi:hypothetical protein